VNSETTGGLQRTLALPRRTSTGLKTSLFFGVLALVVVAVALRDRTPTLSYVRLSFLSGSEKGNYYGVVKRLAAAVAERGGRIKNIATAGSVENIARLVAGQSNCKVQFALVQDGMAWPEETRLELIGRLATPESLVVLGREADRFRTLADLHDKRIGIGPVGSGTERVAGQMLAQLRELNLEISTPSIDEQLDKLQNGELDLGAMIIDENAAILTTAVHDRGLQILDLADAEALARRLPFARAGVIHAGSYDPVRQLPPTDKHVIQIDTLVVGNGCASWSATQGLITALGIQFPDFVRINRERGNQTGLPYAAAARAYFDNNGPDIVGVYAPWLVDLLPTARWIQLIFGLSLLFNAMGFAHRFRLWRIDAGRVGIESEISQLLGPGITVGEIGRMTPEDQQQNPATKARLDDIIERLLELLNRCRKHSLSVLVPMGQEMGYRYQEALIAELLRSLRALRGRLAP
jgi:TRAP-type uncharacterized transport system substrate-binding protein